MADATFPYKYKVRNGKRQSLRPDTEIRTFVQFLPTTRELGLASTFSTDIPPVSVHDKPVQGVIRRLAKISN
ncbi:hypothetical protein EYZ11_000354 [Aspergillus tanneri]|uniref:Uncharacterized protein n=1 Tax=Aspergillus tanneri TaxID=1220188 RepID=A0A4S3JXC0_9EURO|nr:hypothetical protein EYZ11_000354 [Aspergillus tanneri]